MNEHTITPDHVPAPQSWADESIIEHIATEHPLSKDVLERYEHVWDWEKLSENEDLSWSQDLIASFEGQWDWRKLSANEALPWSEDLLIRYEDRWEWGSLSKNQALPWSEALITRYEDRWKWKTLSRNRALPWSEDLIARYEDQWGWGSLSKNQALPWSEDLLGRYEDRWDWGFNALNKNKALPWSEDLIARYEDRWNWKALSQNKGIPWSGDLLARFEDQWHWNLISKSETLPWSEDLIARFEDRWKWEDLGLSENEALPWSEDFIARYKDRWKWDQWGLSENEGLSWSEELIARFEDRWDWRKLSANEGLSCSEDLFVRFEDQWDWEKLSANEALPWSEDLLARYEDRWDWGRLSKNQALPWSEDLIARFEDRWRWGRHCLSTNEALPWSEDFIARFEDRWYWAHLLLKNGSIQWSGDVVMQVIDAFVRPTPLHGAASAGNVNEVKTLLSEGTDPDTGLQEEPQGEAPPIAPLLLACRYQHVDVQKVLLDAGANPNVTSDDGNTPLTYAAADGDLSVARLLLHAGAGQTGSFDSLYSAEEKAYENENMGVGDLFHIAERLDTYRRSSNQASDADSEASEENVEDGSSGGAFGEALGKAASAFEDMLNQQVEQIQEETEGQSTGDADANAGTEEPVDTDSASSASDELVLLQSCREGDLDRTRELLNMGTNPNALTPQRCATPLLVATAFGHAEIVDLLLDHGAHPTIGATAANKTCLMVAASCNEASIAQALLDADASFSYSLFGNSYATGLPRHLSRASALAFAVESRSLETVGAIVDAIFKSPYTRTFSREDTLTNIDSATNVLHRAAKAGSPNIVKLLLDHGASLKKGDGRYRPGRGKTPLEVAQEAGNDEAAKLIQDHQEKASSNQPTPSASPDADSLDSALVEAVENGDASRVSALLDKGANPDGISGSGAPLVSAVKSNSRESLEALLQAGADPDSCQPEHFAGRTALHQAVSDFKLDMVKQLLEAGANPNIPMPGTWGPPLVFLLKESRMSKELLTAFLEAGADPNGREVSMGDETPLHSSWANDNGAELTKLLVEAGADPTPVYRNGEEGDPLISQNMDASMVETYLELGADINALDGARNTVLHRVVKSGRDRDQIRMLLSKGADPNIQNIEGNAPLHTLAEDTGGDSNFRYSATSVLIEYGADPEADANFGRYNSTPLRTASKEDNRPVVDAMSSHGYESW